MTEWCRRLTNVEVIYIFIFLRKICDFAYFTDLKSMKILHSLVVSQYGFEKLTKLTNFPFEMGPSC